jgi:beta-lactamase regulating signal transducer with metallopeptidase domain
MHVMTQVVCAFYWFHPLVWLTARRLHTEQEQACDEDVVLLGARQSEYAAHLLDIARSIAPGGALPVSTWATTCRCTLERRVQSLLKPRRFRRRGLAMLPVLQVSMACVVLFMAVLSPTRSRTWTPRLPVIKSMEDYARRLVENRISCRVSETISQIVSESIAASIALGLRTNLSGGTP